MMKFHRPPNYILKITLLGTSNPTITRTISIPCDYTFDHLHDAIQVAFGWTNSHLYKFDIEHPRTRQNLVSIEDRRAVPSIGMVNLDAEWAHGRRWSPDNALSGVLSLRRFKKKRIIYLYDFGDRWEHEIEVVGRTTRYEGGVTCMGGEGHPCAEDVGGHVGWRRLKQAYLGPSPTNAQRDMCHWYEKHAINGDEQGLGGLMRFMWDVDYVNRELAGTATTFPCRRDQAC